MRNLIFFLFAAAVLSGCEAGNQAAKLPDDGTSQYWQASLKPFYHGVASGDPLSERVIIWTRVTPETEGEVVVNWQVAVDSTMSQVVQSGTFTTGPARDYTVKVDVAGLEPSRHYYYRFEALGSNSVVGRTKTAPSGGAGQVKFAVVSCSNFEAGYFNAFNRIANRDAIDAVLHLGDYIYEYEPGRYGDISLGRLHLPAKEIVTLEDYRTRYSQYRLDPDFQLVHQRHPFITIWDDHEIANNSYVTGAQNHQPETEGDYQARKAAARQAYYEWLPLREDGQEHLYRHIPYGDLVDVLMLDERLAGRTEQAESLEQPGFASQERSMLGREQLEWFTGQLKSSGATWKVIGNQVIFSDFDASVANPGTPRNLDAWDGYPAEKSYLINFIRDNDIQNVVFVSGDTHSSWAFEVPESIEAYKADSTATVAVEFGTTSITSANSDEGRPLSEVLMAEKYFTEPRYNPQLKFVNLHDHGYLLLTLLPEEAVAEWWYVDDLKTRNQAEHLGKIMRVKAGTHELDERQQ